MRPRTFDLVRSEDPSGVSGTGVVAQGVEFGDGQIALQWRNPNPDFVAVAIWPGVDAMLSVHGHGGLTVVRWHDAA